MTLDHRGHVVSLALLLSGGLGCSAGRPFPWAGPREVRPIEHEAVQTVTTGHGLVLVRSVRVPTRANLDYAAYHGNPIIAALEPTRVPPPSVTPVERDAAFSGVLVADSVAVSLAATPLSEAERGRALAFAPLVDWLATDRPALAAGLEDVRAAIEGETWGGEGGPHIVRQRATEAWVHQQGEAAQLWLKIEFEPWVRDFARLPTAHGGGLPELYGRVRADLVSPEVFERIRTDYAERILDAGQLDAWANELASNWYPSYNTDLLDVAEVWPDASTEPEVKAAVGGETFANPAMVMVGKPHGSPIYLVLLIDRLAAIKQDAAAGPGAAPAGVTTVTPQTRQLTESIQRELEAHGGSWDAWAGELAEFHQRVTAELSAHDASVKALGGRDGFLFFRTSIEQMVAGDLRAQPVGKDPFPVIVAFKELLARHGVDFLFVPVPTKAAVYADKLSSGAAQLKGQVVTPYERKLILELGRAGVEVIDLLPAYLAERARAGGVEEPLYLAQDTHWTDRGLQLAARLIAERIRGYPWLAELEPLRSTYTVKPSSSMEEGDLPSRLGADERRRYSAVKIPGHQVVRADGSLYEDEADSPITVLGDSFVGVFERTFCRHAGLSAHVARELGIPVDLVMSYGGGPNVRKKLLKRGAEALKRKRVVIWVMAARDLFNYWEDWELLEVD